MANPANVHSLPPSLHDDRAKALRVLAERLSEIDFSCVLVDRIDSVPASAVNVLMKQFHAIPYSMDGTLTDPEKRSRIKSSVPLHRLFGTPAGFKRIAKLVGGTVTHIWSPPAKLFLSPNLTIGEKNAFLTIYPQLRIYRFSRPSLEVSSRVRGEGGGEYKHFLCDNRLGAYIYNQGLGNTRGDGLHSFFMADTMAGDRFGPQAYIWDKGVESPLKTAAIAAKTVQISVRSFAVSRYLDSSAHGLGTNHTMFLGVLGFHRTSHRTIATQAAEIAVLEPGIATYPDFALLPEGGLGGVETTADKRLFTVSTDVFGAESTVDRLSTILPSLDPISTTPEFVTQRGPWTFGMYFGEEPRPRASATTPGPTRFFMESTAELRIYDRYYLFSADRSPQRHPATTFLGNTSRLGFPPKLAEIDVELLRHKPLPLQGRFIGKRGFYFPPIDLTQWDQLLAGFKWSVPVASKILVNTRTLEPLTSTDGVIAGDHIAGEWGPVTSVATLPDLDRPPPPLVPMPVPAFVAASTHRPGRRWTFGPPPTGDIEIVADVELAPDIEDI